MKAFESGTKVKLKRRIWRSPSGFLGIRKGDSVPRGARGKVIGRKWWEGQYLYKVDFGKLGSWGVKRSDLTVLGGKG